MLSATIKDLPVEVQTVAAETLRAEFIGRREQLEKEPVEKLAHEVRDAFIALYSPAGCASTQHGSD